VTSFHFILKVVAWLMGIQVSRSTVYFHLCLGSGTDHGSPRGGCGWRQLTNRTKGL